MKKITVVEVNDISNYPPVQSLLRILLDLGYKINLISFNTKSLPIDLYDNTNIKCFEIPNISCNNKIKKIFVRIYSRFFIRYLIKKCMLDSNYLWTTSLNTLKIVGSLPTCYKNVLQLFELSKFGYHYKNHFKFSIEKIAQKSWKNVVCEINRAYIEKIWWNLPSTPYVLPNKPYSIDYGDINDDVKNAISKMKNEKRKIILYLGGIYPDRNFETFAKVISKKSDYVLYIAGKAFSKKSENLLKDLINNYNVVYLGAFVPPQHLAIVKYSYIGLLPYKPISDGILSELNALYCAPNKIYEYSGFGVPMIGSDVIGLLTPFEKWNIGKCCDENDENSIENAINCIDNNHEEMSNNCYNFFESTNLKEIVNSILSE